MKKELKSGTKLEWDLTLLYKDEKDPQIEQDLIAIETACSSFEKKYKGKDFTSTPQKLFKALRDYSHLLEAQNGTKPVWYFGLRTEINSDDSVAAALATKCEQRLMDAGNRVTFFDLTLAKIPKKEQKQLLANENLAEYQYMLERIFLTAQYNLTESEEQLESLLLQPSYTMWVDGQQKLLTQQTVQFKGKQLPISEAESRLAHIPKGQRDMLQKSISAKLEAISAFAESEINAVYTYKKVMDMRRGYKNPYTATVISYENDEKTVEALVETVTKYFTVSKRFYKVHAKILGLNKLSMGDRGVPAGVIKKKFTFDATVEMVKKAFSRVDGKYAEYLDNFLDRGQIDVFPRKGKKGGAYCYGSGELPTFVLLNHTDDIRSVEVLAHEAGHAIHTELSKQQPLHYQGYSTACAEVASTFFEQLVSDELESILSEKEQIILLHNRILSDVSTIFRQIAFFNFELELHNEIRDKGQVSKGAIADMMNKHFLSYAGDVFDITHEDGYFFVSLSHMRSFFYVYSYAFGQIISRALYTKWKENPTYAEKVHQFLSSGCSMSPRDIFRNIGINIADPTFFESGLQAIEADIVRLEKLVKKSK